MIDSLAHESTTIAPVEENSGTLVQEAQNKTLSTEEKQANHDLVASAGTMGLGLMKSHALLPMPFGVYLSAASLGYSSLPMFRRTEDHVKDKRLTNEGLNTLVVMGCAITGQFLAGGMVIFFYYVGDKVLARTRDHSKRTLMSIFGQQVRSVWVLRENVEVETPLEEVHAGDIVVVHTSETIPVDGKLVKGRILVDQHLLTGESQPVEKSVGDEVMASTLLISGQAHVKVERAGKDTTVAQIQQVLDNTSDYKSKAQLKGEEIGDTSAPLLLAYSALNIPFMGIAGGALILNSSKFGNRSRILMSLDTLNYTALAAHRGVLIKDGRALESMMEIDTILFDKTGTLTEEQPEVGNILACPEYEAGIDENGVLYYAAIAEYKLNHPIAKAIVQEAKARDMDLPVVENSNYHVGFGIHVEVEDKDIYVGSARFIEMESIELPNSISEAMLSAHDDGHSLIVVAIGKEVCGAIEIQTAIRPEVYKVIESLREHGVEHLAIVSGDHEQPTRKLAKLLDMDEYYAGVLPDQKADIVAKLQDQGRKVCFIGDGVNDSIAMKKADVSISLAGASTVATDTAQIILTDGNLIHFAEAITLAKTLKKHTYTSMALIIGMSAVSVIGVYGAGLTMIQSILFSVSGYSFGLYHSMRPLRVINKEKRLEEENKELLQ